MPAAIAVSVLGVDSRTHLVRVAIIGTGTVGHWLLRAMRRDGGQLAARYGVDLRVVAVGRRDGLVHDPAGIDIEELLALRASGGSLASLGESTVMSGTPVLAALTDGLCGATPVRLRGVLNATVNFMCSRMEQGASYPQALAEAQAAGLAERDPTADVDGLDSVAKLMVLSALVFGEQLELRHVARHGLSELVASGLEPGARIREVATLDPAAGRRSITATALAEDDPLGAITGVTNCIRLEAEPLGEVSVAGPGAGPALAGHGVFSHLIALAQHRVAR